MKRGQVAFIAIIGVLVVIAVGGALVIFRPASTPSQSHNDEPLMRLENCAQQEFDQSIALSGLYGGGWNLDPDFVTKGDYFNMSGHRFAIWTEPVQVPTVQQLDNDTQSLLASRLSSCLDLVNATGPRTVSVSVQLQNDTSRAAVQFDGSLVSSNGEQRIPSFTVESTLPVVRARDIASGFADEVWHKQILKDLNFNLIALDRKVPVSGISYTCVPKQWSVKDVKQAFYSSLQDVAPAVSFDGHPRVSDPNISSKLTFDVSALPPDVPISAYYFTDYGGSFDVQRSSAGRMSSMVTKSGDGVLCQNTYQFWYSMNYPLVFTLKVPDSTGDYLFRFAMRVDVARNHLSSGSVATTASQDSTFCSEVTPRSFSLNVLDSSTGEPVKNLTATYVCGDQSCALNTSDGKVSDRLPARCLSADIELAAQGYDQKTVKYQYTMPLSGTTVKLDPMRDISFRLQCQGRSQHPCAFDGFVMANVNGTSYPLTTGDNYVPNADASISVFEQLPDGTAQVAVEPFALASGTSVSLVLDTNRYAAANRSSWYDPSTPSSASNIFISGTAGGSS